MQMRAFELGHHADSDSSKGIWHDGNDGQAPADGAAPVVAASPGDSASPAGSVKGVWAAKGADSSGRRVVHTFDVEEA